MPLSITDRQINTLLVYTCDLKIKRKKISAYSVKTKGVRGLAWLGSVPGVHEFRGSNLCLC